jgi:hypothetical protein
MKGGFGRPFLCRVTRGTDTSELIMHSSIVSKVIAVMSSPMDDDQLDRYRAKAEECERHARSSADLAIKLGFVTLALEWHKLAKHRWKYLSGGACNRRATADGNVVTLPGPQPPRVGYSSRTSHPHRAEQLHNSIELRGRYRKNLST